MISIKGKRISISRGDCQPFTITFTGTDVPPDGTAVLFTVKKTSSHQEAVIEKKVFLHESKIEIQLRNADTKDLPFGSYEWDVRIPDLYGESEPYTPMEPAPFEIVKVIGNV